jgi:hypothetical protein
LGVNIWILEIWDKCKKILAQFLGKRFADIPKPKYKFFFKNLKNNDAIEKNG